MGGSGGGRSPPRFGNALWGCRIVKNGEVWGGEALPGLGTLYGEGNNLIIPRFRLLVVDVK